MKKGIFFVLGGILLVLVVAIALSGGGGPYSVLSTEPSGSRAAFLLLREYGFDVDYRNGPIEKNDAQLEILLGPDYYAPGDKELVAQLKWVYDGGELMLFGDCELLADKLSGIHLPETLDENFYYAGTETQYGKGRIYVSEDYSLLSNDFLRSEAVGFINEMWRHKNKKIRFIEYGKMPFPVTADGDSAEVGPFDLMPLSLYLVLVQLVLGVLLFSLFFRRRIGKPEVYAKAVYREENEDVLALANLMKKQHLLVDAVHLCSSRLPVDLRDAWTNSGSFPDGKLALTDAKDIVNSIEDARTKHY